MKMWEKRAEDLEVNTGETSVQQTGIYKITFTKCNIFKSKTSQAEALVFQGLTEDNEKVFYKHFYKKADGSELGYGVRFLNHLCFLCNIDSDNLRTERNGDEEIIKDFVGKTIIAYIEANQRLYDGKTITDLNVVQYYNPTTRQTTKEMRENKNASTYETAQKKAEKTRERQEYVKSQTDENAEDFPF